jgi:hypothetical protein
MNRGPIQGIQYVRGGRPSMEASLLSYWYEWWSVDGCPRRHCRRPHSCAQIPNGTCLVAAMNTHTHTWRHSRIMLLFVKLVTACFHVGASIVLCDGWRSKRWRCYVLSSCYKRSLFHESGSTRKRIWMSGVASWHQVCDIQWRSHTHIMCFQHWKTTALKFLHLWKNICDSIAAQAPMEVVFHVGT